MGANMAIFSLVEAALLRPLPYPDSSQLCVLWKSVPARDLQWDWTSYPTIRDWREQTHSFVQIAAILRPEGGRVEWNHQRIQAAKVEDSFFEIAAMPPALGRVFSGSEAFTAVLSHAFWQQQFGARKDMLGQTLLLDNRPFTVIGVMPADFQIPDGNTRIWIPLASDSRWSAFERMRVADAFSAIARLKPALSPSQAHAQMDSL